MGTKWKRRTDVIDEQHDKINDLINQNNMLKDNIVKSSIQERKTLLRLRTTRANLKSAIEITKDLSVIALLKVTLKDIEKSLEENNFA